MVEWQLIKLYMLKHYTVNINDFNNFNYIQKFVFYTNWKKQNMKWYLHIFINMLYIKTYKCLKEKVLEKIHKMSFLTCENFLLRANTTF